MRGFVRCGSASSDKFLSLLNTSDQQYDSGLPKSSDCVGEADLYFEDDNLTQWKPVHSARARLENGRLVISDSVAEDWHLVRFQSDDVLFRNIELTIVFCPCSTMSANFYVHQYGGGDIIMLSRIGAIVGTPIARDIQITMRKGNEIEARFVYFNKHNTISIGLAKETVEYSRAPVTINMASGRSTSGSLTISVAAIN
jgi:hypothetical protein